MIPPCSDLSRARAEPLLATASRVERWLLVEQCGPWGPPAVPLARMEAELGRHLTAEAARGGARLLLLRHPRGIACPPGRQVFVVDSRPGHERVLRRSFHGDADLSTAELPLGQPAADGWEAVEDPLLLVCTHGKHDRCCAVRGRPVAEALSARWPGRTWECSHVGGDRFAANLVVLPEGQYVAQVEAAEAVDAVTQMAAGRLPVRHLRGRSSLSLPVQAAQHFARTETGRDRADDLLPVEQSGAGADRWRVRLRGGDDLPDVEVQVHYERHATEPALLNCGAEQAKTAPRFTCTGLRTLVG